MAGSRRHCAARADPASPGQDAGRGGRYPDGPDHDFFRRVAAETDARRIVDLGCGTGLLTVTLTGPGRVVTGIDPDPAMLQRASSRPGGDAVIWRLGTAELLLEHARRRRGRAATPVPKPPADRDRPAASGTRP
ncbi:class I SAM-dependent methyltransferase [Micropruina sonneratiae]|uniref:class I SAM-dependent methyltransferase n=1 Tax=Micropruina sonneratiae TaxID=2986940 RepID=UPI0039B6F770